MGITNPCRAYIHTREEFKSYPECVVGIKTRIGPLALLVTTHVGRYGIEDKTDSLARDGSNSWDVINRGVDRYVTELSMEYTGPMYVDTTKLGTVTSVTFMQYGRMKLLIFQQKGRWTHSHRSNKLGAYSWCGQTVVPLSHINLEDNDFSCASFSEASRSRWSCLLTTLMKFFFLFRDQLVSWTFDQWKESWKNGTDKTRFEFFLDQRCRIWYVMSSQGHSGGVHIHIKLQK